MSTVAHSQSATEGYLTEKLQNAREALIIGKYYLGTPEESWADKLTWKRIGKAGRLVTVEDDAVASAAYKSFEESDQRGKPPNPPDPVILSAVVRVSDEDYWLTSCGMWNGLSPVARTLADVKPTCVGIAPGHSVFAEDFRFVLDNVERLMEMSRVYERRKGVLITGANPRIKFRHVLFEVRACSKKRGGEGPALNEKPTGS
ncbi:hypothetical protein M378DRAFT_182185 [Amanita muscaria Koide BX008]|uniref:Uncharacterized protein n=1 Tax=Amanita muscaria (strain Koide BX008) TaxID=946122 RepID=A0A0C2RZ45_AMAMK|nr:hypothetical protein M378DRAFT_182185 [Amanita muscaria Koide BX008]